MVTSMCRWEGGCRRLAGRRVATLPLPIALLLLAQSVGSICDRASIIYVVTLAVNSATSSSLRHKRTGSGSSLSATDTEQLDPPNSAHNSPSCVMLWAVRSTTGLRCALSHSAPHLGKAAQSQLSGFTQAAPGTACVKAALTERAAVLAAARSMAAAAAAGGQEPAPAAAAAEDASSGSAPPADPLLQYVILRRDLWTELDWPLGSVVAQGCHAATAALWESREAGTTLEYCAPENIDHMHKVWEVEWGWGGTRRC